jgi:hypothetical protein
MPWIVLATTYAVLRFTVPEFMPDPGTCSMLSQAPERSLAYCWLDWRTEGTSTWVRDWKVGVQGSHGDTLVIGIPKNGPTWFRIFPVDSAGNVACSANEVLIP